MRTGVLLEHAEAKGTKRQRRIVKWALIVAIVGGLCAWPAIRLYHHFMSIRQSSQQVERVAQALGQHHVQSLLGSEPYIAANSHRLPDGVAAVGTVGCQPKDRGTKATNVTSGSFAYVLNYKVADDCNLKRLVSLYGKPNASAVIAGKIDRPDVVLLFYDKGAHKYIPPTSPTTAKAPTPDDEPATVVPISLSQLGQRQSQSVSCSSTTVNIVAHEDDDLLFLSPDLIHDIQGGACVRTIYLTAGDAGSNEYYWLGREQGSQAAYSLMTPQQDDLWIQRIIKLGDNQFIRISSPRANPRINLIFFRLPDGGMNGRGFAGEKYQSLGKLKSGVLKSLRSVDNQSEYSSDELIAALTSLLQFYQPTQIRSQSEQRTISKDPYPDHPDHIATGYLAATAYKRYEKGKFTPYHGYPIHGMAANLSTADYQLKEDIFLQYGKSDPSVCHTEKECHSTATYNSYLWRQYTAPY